MAQDADLLVWIDMEMTGLRPEIDRIIEVALVVTDAALTTIAQAPVLVVHQDDATLAAMDSWNQSTHARSGLIDKVKASTLDEATVEQRMLAFLREHVPPRTSPRSSQASSPSAVAPSSSSSTMPLCWGCAV